MDARAAVGAAVSGMDLADPGHCGGLLGLTHGGGSLHLPGGMGGGPAQDLSRRLPLLVCLQQPLVPGPQPLVPGPRPGRLLGRTLRAAVRRLGRGPNGVSLRTHVRSGSPVIPGSAATAAYVRVPPDARHSATASLRNSSGFLHGRSSAVTGEAAETPSESW